MRDADRSRLLFGPYRTPRCRVGQRVRCLARGAVTVHALTDAPIPWPVGKRGRALSLVLCGDLARAVRRESVVAVAHWWCPSGKRVRFDSPMPAGAWDGMALGRV
jgi:hypothetical protein